MERDTTSAVAGSSRRRFLRRVAGLAALAASLGSHRGSGPTARGSGPVREPGSQLPRIRIRSVDAYPVYINQRSDGLLDPPSFSADDDPRRWRYNGAFAQLPSAIIAVIKTDQGIAGSGWAPAGARQPRSFTAT